MDSVHYIPYGNSRSLWRDEVEKHISQAELGRTCVDSREMPQQLKRKDPEGGLLIQDDVVTVSIPSKKLRQDFSPSSYEVFSAPLQSQAQPVDITIEDAPSLVSPQLQQQPLLITEVDADDRAIVLYKPMTPPLFPGGPPSGSSDLPFQLSAAFKLSDVGSSSQWILQMRRANDPSCSSLAMIPWAPQSSTVRCVSKGRDSYGGSVIIEDITDQEEEEEQQQQNSSQVEEEDMQIEESAPMEEEGEGEGATMMEEDESPATVQVSSSGPLIPGCDSPSQPSTWQQCRPWIF